MNKTLLLFLFSMCLFKGANAQVTIDTVSLGAAYSNQKWYSLENGEQGTQAANNWDIALAATASMSSSLTTSILFNPKAGTVYQIPASVVANFNTADTTGLSTWSELNNSDTTWIAGAFNNTPSIGSNDYGWGSYNSTSHNIEANRVFIVKYTNNTFRKLYINLNAMAGIYTLVSDKLDNSDRDSATISIAPYAAKNFLYYSLTTKAIVDREPATSTWDLTFTQYTAFVPSAYTVTGILSNLGVTVAQANNIANVATYTEFSAHSFSNSISEIGSDWKSFNGAGYEITDSLAYFVKTATGNVWKLIPLGFGGSSNGDFIFSKEMISATGIAERNGNGMAAFTMYPNPSTNENTSIFYTIQQAVSTGSINVFDLSGKTVFAAQLNNGVGQNVYSLNTANLQAGMYFVALKIDATSTVQKLIIK